VHKADSELEAINAIVAALKPLRDEERKRVLEYVLGRFDALPVQRTLTSSGSAPLSQLSTGAPSAGALNDIRTLKEQKNPRSASEMAALVAYYISELAPSSERRTGMNKEDVERYFKTAGFKLTAKAGQTLINAKNAGYLDSAGEGQYKLNPVGYNLVVHRLGGDGSGRKRRRKSEVKATRRSKR